MQSGGDAGEGHKIPATGARGPLPVGVIRLVVMLAGV